MLKIENLEVTFNLMVAKVTTAFTQVETYSQVGLIIVIYLFSYGIAKFFRSSTPLFQNSDSALLENPIARFFDGVGKLLLPVLFIIFLKLSVELSQYITEGGWVMKLALAIAILLFFNSFINLLVTHPIATRVFRWVGMPIIFFYVTDMLGGIISVLDSMGIQLGKTKLTAYELLRTLIFGSLLFWLGRVSNRVGQTIIRKQESFDVKSRELFAKLFEIILFFVISILILELMGINLTALAVFGGAIGVGLGFGLQAIASNFISGVIIIMDKSVSVGDHIEMEDGKSGLVTQLNLRSTTVETYDGKDIVIPNEKFITGVFTNWTHKNNKQRYSIDFSVAYNTDVRSMMTLIKEAVAAHPQVLSGEEWSFEEQPDCEFASFGDSGLNMVVEFWMEGIDDGKNRVASDLLLIIFETLQENGIEIPFPQRDVHIIEADT